MVSWSLLDAHTRRQNSSLWKSSFEHDNIFFGKTCHAQYQKQVLENVRRKNPTNLYYIDFSAVFIMMDDYTLAHNME